MFGLFDPEDLPIYESYINGKMTKRTRAKECLELVHIDMHGAYSVYAQGGYGYFIPFSSDYSRFRYVNRKYDVLNIFIEFKARSDNLLVMHTKSLQLDCGGKFDSFYWSMGFHCKMQK